MRARRWQLAALVGVTLGCGARSELLLDRAAASADAAQDDVEAAIVGRTPENDATAMPYIDAKTEVVVTGNADADAVAAPAGPPESGCGPKTCDGCCREDGTCVARSAVTARFCGSGGHGCLTCPPGITCDGVNPSDGTIVCGYFF
jgi:hypothetical protein